MNCNSIITVSHERKRGNFIPIRNLYLPNEDQSIVNYIIADEERYMYSFGNDLWLAAERQNVCHNRSAQSMRSRFQSYILHNLHKYNVPGNVIRKIRKYHLASRIERDRIRRSAVRKKKVVLMMMPNGEKSKDESSTNNEKNNAEPEAIKESMKTDQNESTLLCKTKNHENRDTSLISEPSNKGLNSSSNEFDFQNYIHVIYNLCKSIVEDLSEDEEETNGEMECDSKQNTTSDTSNVALGDNRNKSLERLEINESENYKKSMTNNKSVSSSCSRKNLIELNQLQVKRNRNEKSALSDISKLKGKHTSLLSKMLSMISEKKLSEVNEYLSKRNDSSFVS